MVLENRVDKIRRKPRVVVAMSGGVDSSVAAALLCKAGCDVVGISMKLWSKEFCGRERAKSCCSTKDLADARFVAGQLGIPFYALDFSNEFKKEVMDYFCEEYVNGRTPNPCIACNNKIKFGWLLKKARQLKADYIATGHYANVGYDRRIKRHILSQGRDKSKDQSYFLFGLTQRQLGCALFPLGKYLKSEVRDICKRLGLKVAQKQESQEICFIWDSDYPKFLKERYSISPTPGDIITKDGRVLGRHRGVIFFTIGQRKGLGLGGKKEPLYVLEIDVKNNRLIVGPKEELRKKTLLAGGISWIRYSNTGAHCPKSPIKIKARIRYNHPLSGAVVHPAPDGKARVVFDKPQSAIAPGQAVVFYKGEEVLGGGWIREA